MTDRAAYDTPQCISVVTHNPTYEGDQCIPAGGILSSGEVSPPRISPATRFHLINTFPQRRQSNDGYFNDDRKIRLSPSVRESRDGAGSILGLDTIPETEQKHDFQDDRDRDSSHGLFGHIKQNLATVTTRLRVSLDGNFSRKSSSSLGPGTKVEKLVSLAEKRGGVAAKFAHKIREMDRDRNGYIDADDLVDCMVDLAQEQQQRRFWFSFALASLVTTLVTIVVIVGLSVLIAERFKDTAVSGSTMVVKGSSEAVQVASTDFMLANGSLVVRDPSADDGGDGLVNVASRLTTLQACPLDLTMDTLRHLDGLQFMLDAARNLTTYLKPYGFVLGPDSITFFTDMGELSLGAGCSSITGSVIDKFVSMGFMPEGATGPGGRHLLQWANLYISTKSYSTKTHLNYFG